METTLSFATWTAALSARGFTVLPSSHAVPIELWLRTPVRGGGNDVLHLRARGTSVTLRRYSAAVLAGLILRSECDCEEHRLAGAATRFALTPGAVPLAEAVYDGAAELGWSSHEAGLLGVPAAAVLLDELLPQVMAARATRVA